MTIEIKVNPAQEFKLAEQTSLDVVEIAAEGYFHPINLDDKKIWRARLQRSIKSAEGDNVSREEIVQAIVRGKNFP